MNDAILSLLGMVRRSGRLSTGHDAVISAITKNKSKLCLLSREASQRLQNEIKHACGYDNKNIPVIFSRYTTMELSEAIGIKAAVVSVDDEGFAKAIMKKYTDSQCD